MLFYKFWIIVLIVIFVIITLIFNKNNNVECESINIPVNGNRGKSEQMVAEEFTKIIIEYGGDKHNISYNKRPEFLVNPETGRRLELDMYYNDGDIKIGIEYQGKQHLEYPNKFHPDTSLGKANFEALQRRDKCKKDLCENNNVCLVEVPYTCDTCDYRNDRYIYNPKITSIEKRRRIREYLIPRINLCLIHQD